MTAKRPATRRTTSKASPAARSRLTSAAGTKPAVKKTVKNTVKKSAKPMARTAAQAKPKPLAATRAASVGTPARPAAPATRKAAAAKAARTLRDVVLGALAELKAVDVKALDVRGLTDITDTMVVASGTSDRHVKSLAERVTQRCKEAGFRPYGTEGERDGEWVLVDLQDVVLHVMLPRVREFYALEKLWAGGAAA